MNQQNRRRSALEGLFELAGVLGDAMQRALAGDGLTPARAEVVWRLQQQGRMTQRELSEALHCTPRNVTGLVDGLEAAGLVRRRPHPSDRRATLVVLTEAGAERAAAWQAGYDALAAEAFAELDAADLDRLATMLERVLPRLRATIAGGGAA